MARGGGRFRRAVRSRRGRRAAKFGAAGAAAGGLGFGAFKLNRGIRAGGGYRALLERGRSAGKAARGAISGAGGIRGAFRSMRAIRRARKIGVLGGKVDVSRSSRHASVGNRTAAG